MPISYEEIAEIRQFLSSATAAEIEQGLSRILSFIQTVPPADPRGRYTAYVFPIGWDEEEGQGLALPLEEASASMCLKILQIQAHQRSLRECPDLVTLAERIIAGGVDSQRQLVELLCRYEGIYPDRHLPEEESPIRTLLEEVLPRLELVALEGLMDWAVHERSSDYGPLLLPFLERAEPGASIRALERWVPAIRAVGNDWILERALERTNLPSPVRGFLERTLAAPPR
jgi:hypothetical protein